MLSGRCRPLLVALFVASLASTTVAAAADGCPWEDPSPWDVFPDRARGLPSLPHRLLPDEQVPEALARLEEVSFYEVPSSDLVKYGVEEPGSGRAFIVRAAAYQLLTGRFDIWFDDGELYVYHGSLSGQGNSRCLPLLVFLQKAPTRVIVVVSTAK